jgi:phosphoglycerate dehydrogenase-like enzyme
VPPPSIVYNFSPMGAGLEVVLQPLMPDCPLVPWPGPGDILLGLDRAWDNQPADSPIPPEIAWVHLLSTGVGNFPLAALAGRPLTSSKGASSPAIAEFCIASMLAFEKQLPGAWISEPPEAWGRAALGGLQAKTLGLIGIGTIGSEVARRALAFDMNVVALRRSGAPADNPAVEISTSLHDVLARSDHVVVAAPATADTYHLLDAAAFEAVKPGVHLVNVARGSLVDQDALLAALDSRRVAMASLDVTDPEPLPAGHWIYSHPRVHLTPHMSWSAPQTLPAMINVFVDNLSRWREGRPLVGVVDVAAGY